MDSPQYEVQFLGSVLEFDLHGHAHKSGVRTGRNAEAEEGEEIEGLTALNTWCLWAAMVDSWNTAAAEPQDTRAAGHH